MSGDHYYENEGGLAGRMESLQHVGSDVICSQHGKTVLTIRTMGADCFSHFAVHLTLRGWFSDVNVERLPVGNCYKIHLHSAKELHGETFEETILALVRHFEETVAAAERKNKRRPKP